MNRKTYMAVKIIVTFLVMVIFAIGTFEVINLFLYIGFKTPIMEFKQVCSLGFAFVLFMYFITVVNRIFNGGKK